MAKLLIASSVHGAAIFTVRPKRAWFIQKTSRIASATCSRSSTRTGSSSKPKLVSWSLTRQKHMSRMLRTHNGDANSIILWLLWSTQNITRHTTSDTMMDFHKQTTTDHRYCNGFASQPDPKIDCSNNLTYRSSGESSKVFKTSEIFEIGPIATKR